MNGDNMAIKLTHQELIDQENVDFRNQYEALVTCSSIDTFSKFTRTFLW